VTDREDPQPGPPEQRSEPPAEQPGHRQARKRPSLADVFGDVLPDLTSDERAQEPGTASADTWYQDNRPPHHDQR
jgi:hypothetical protein